MQSKIQQQKGYTIIETMIAVSLFLVIVMSGMGAILNANLLHQKSRDMRSIIDSLSFAMEDMSRNIRTGYNYHCVLSSDSTTPTLAELSTPKSCANGYAIVFESSNGSVADLSDQWIYYIASGKLYKATHGPYTDPNTDPASGFVQLTPDEIVFDSVNPFSVLGALPPGGDSQQPLVTIRLSGTITYKNIVSPFSLQTSASQREIDI